MNRVEEDKIDNDFKAFAREHRWRLVQGEDRTPIAITRSRAYPKDHIFCGFMDGVGVSIERLTPGKVTVLVRKLKALGCTLRQRGELEANLFVPFDKSDVVAKLLKIKKGNQGANSGCLERFRLRSTKSSGGILV